MKKMIKWSVILGIVFCLAGIGVITAGAMMGGVEEIESYNYNMAEWFGNRYRTYPEHRTGTAQAFDRRTAAPGDDTVMDIITYEHVKKLKLETGPGEVVILAEDRENPQDTAIRIESHSEVGVLTYAYNIRQEEDELEIERHHEFENIVGPFKDRDDDYQTRRMETLVIYIPRNYQFREVEIEAAASYVEADEIHTDKLGLELMAGELLIGQGTAGELEAECKAGSMEIGLEGKKEQYDYDLSCSLGTITLEGGDEEIFDGGIHRDQYIDHRAGRRAELECEAGEIVVRFTDM